jgi:glycosyltransferase involved in cell wall biosynthesis
MKIAININELTLKQETGVKVYTREIVRALTKIDNNNEYILYTNKFSKTELNSEISKSSSVLGNTNNNFEFRISNFNLPFWTYTKLPQEIKKDKPDVLFMPIQSVPFINKPKNIKIVITVHDLAFLIFPEYFTTKDKFLLNFHTKRAVQMADRIIAPSKATKKDLIKFYKVNENKIRIIYHGVSPNSKFQILNSKFNNPYILFVGQIQPRKNLIRLIEAFELIKEKNKKYPNLKLTIAGGNGWMANKTYEKARASKFSKDIIFTGKVDNKRLAELYQNALVFVMPSLYEGFGLIVLEAMSCGIPCAVSDNSSLAEIVDDHGLLFDAYSSSDIAQKISMFLNNDVLRKDFAQRSLQNVKKFTWEKSARETLETFSK